MPWLKLVHLSAVIVWAGALLYLPWSIAAAGTPQRMPRGIFTGVATPAALLAIASGTVLFLLHGLLAPWLIAKLALVSLLVLGHAACGMLILRNERGHPVVAFAASCVTAASALWLALIAWLVLGKPF